MGKSPRGVTDELLADALFACLETTPIDKISVKSITDECGLNRQTFYYHFHDIYDLIRWILEREAKRVVHAAAGAKDIYDCISAMVRSMDEHRVFFMALYNSTSYPSLRQDFMEYLTAAQKDELPAVLVGFEWGPSYTDFIARINALILTEFIEKWQTGQSVNTLDQFAKRFSLFILQQQRGARAMAQDIKRSQSGR